MLIQLSSTLNGLTTVRAHRCQSAFQKTFEDYQDVQTSAFYMGMVAARWFAVRFDILCIVYTVFVSIICFAVRGSKYPNRTIFHWISIVSFITNKNRSSKNFHLKVQVYCK